MSIHSTSRPALVGVGKSVRSPRPRLTVKLPATGPLPLFTQSTALRLVRGRRKSQNRRTPGCPGHARWPDEYRRQRIHTVTGVHADGDVQRAAAAIDHDGAATRVRPRLPHRRPPGWWGWSGSPASLPAPTLAPFTDPDPPVSNRALLNWSLAGAWPAFGVTALETVGRHHGEGVGRTVGQTGDRDAARDRRDGVRGDRTAADAQRRREADRCPLPAAAATV